MKFSEVVGHESLKQHLAQSVKEQRIAHAQLFLGKEGSGALPMAMAYATLVNCEQPEASDSCGVCNSCRKIGHYMHADLHFTFPTISPVKQSRELIEKWRKSLTAAPYLTYKQWLTDLEAENKQGNITADEVKDIVKRLSLKTVEGKYKIQMIWGAEYLGKEGNMLLKILEEPPEQTLFLLIGEDSEKILPTILSRTQVIKVSALTAAEISEALQSRMDCESERAAQIAALADGNWNTALEVFEQADNDLLDQLKLFLNGCLTNSDRRAFITMLEGIAQSGREQIKMFLEYFLTVLEKSFVYRYTGEMPLMPGEAEKAFIGKMADRVEADKLEPLLQDISKAHYYIERNANPKIVLFNLYLSVRRGLSKSATSEKN